MRRRPNPPMPGTERIRGKSKRARPFVLEVQWCNEDGWSKWKAYRTAEEREKAHAHLLRTWPRSTFRNAEDSPNA